MTDFANIDFFNDLSLVDDPFPYFEYLRGLGSIVPLPGHAAVAVVGFEEGVVIHSDNVNFSAVNSVTGPLPPIPFVPDGEDISLQIAEHRAQMPFGLELLTQDPPMHTRLRSLLMRLFTPSRLRAMRPYLVDLANRLVDEARPGDRIDFLRDYASPYAMYAIADLLGVPEEDRPEFRRMLGATPSQIGSDARVPLINPLEFRKARFIAYIEDRRRIPRGDILGDLANATYPDGSTPELIDVVRAASILFGAGQDTTATLLGSCMRILGERQDLQQQLRAAPSLVPAFIEEVLRFAGPVKGTFRLAKKRVTVAGVEIAPGTTVMLTPLAMNRDPRRFDDPAEFRLDRPGAKDHLAFGRGPHTCPDAALAREEVRISLETILSRLSDIRLDEDVHGPAGARHFRYVPSYAFRSLADLQLRVIRE